METLAFILHNLPAIGERTLEHLSIVSVAVGVAILTGVPLGIAITQSRRAADTVLYLGSIVMTIPSIALFGVLIPILSKIGQGIGWLPAVIAAMLYAQLPIIRNTYTAIRNVDPALRSAAIGMGMSVAQRLARVEIPIALPVIIAGVRISVVINIGVTAIAAYIGAGGLGTFISRGISQSDIRQLITGALALGLLGWDAARRRRREEELLALLALEPAPFADRYPNELSGGQAQRVGVARALAVDPPVLLMDEPFAALDPVNREAIQDEFLRMQRKLRKTILFVSHDIDEAVKMADRIAIFHSGRLVQFAAPDEMLAHPADAFVAGFVGRDRTLKRLRLTRVREVMTASEGAIDASVPAVSPDDDLRGVAALFLEFDAQSLRCIDEGGRLIGIVTRQAIAARLAIEDHR